MSTSPSDGVDVDTLLSCARAAAATAEPGGIAYARNTVHRIALGDAEVVLADPAMVGIYDLIRRLARSTLPILIQGETGVGKELAAAAVHTFSTRAAGPFVSINCAAIPEHLAESELFGHERGAFTGAVTAKQGQLEVGNGGTVFLDEIGELPLAVQAKLLRVLETGELTRVGDVKPRVIDIRIVAATNRDLAAEVEGDRFRRDLFFRLGAAQVVVPPLRDRPRDLAMLAHRLFGEACAPPAEPVVGDAARDARAFRPIDDEVRELERRRMIEALAATGGVQNKAAELIEMPLRTFVTKLKRYAISAADWK